MEREHGARRRGGPNRAGPVCRVPRAMSAVRPRPLPMRSHMRVIVNYRKCTRFGEPPSVQSGAGAYLHLIDAAISSEEAKKKEALSQQDIRTPMPTKS